MFGFCSIVYTILYMINIILTRLSDKTIDEELSMGLFLIWMAVTVLSALFLLPIQKAVNEHNHKLNPDHRPLNFFLSRRTGCHHYTACCFTLFALNGYEGN